MTKKILCTLFALLMFSGYVVADAQVDTLVENGKTELFDNDNPIKALDSFDSALVLDSSDQRANFWRALTAVFGDSNLLTNLENLNAINSSRDVLVFDNDGDLDYEFDRVYPDGTALQSVADGVLDEIDSAIANMSNVGVAFSDTAAVGDYDAVGFDYGDAKALESILYLLKLQINIAVAYDADSLDLQQLIFGSDFDLKTFLTSYSDVFKKTVTCNTEMLVAKQAFIDMMTSYMEGSDYIRNTRSDNDGENHFVRYYDPYDSYKFSDYQEWQDYKEDALDIEENARDLMSDISANLVDLVSNPVIDISDLTEEGKGTDTLINLDTFFTNPKDWRAIIDEYSQDEDLIHDDFSDTTLGGIAPSFGVADWNFVFDNASYINRCVIYENEGTNIYLSWDPSPEDNDSVVTSYKVFRSTSCKVDDSSYLVATITNPVVTSCTDMNVDISVATYYYRVYTYYSCGVGETATSYGSYCEVPLVIYVDASNSDDQDQDGSVAHPYSDLGEAIDYEVCEGTIIKIAAGFYNEYSETLYLPSGIKLEGGYDSTDWSRDIQLNKTIIDSGDEHGDTIHIGSGTSYIVLDGLYVCGTKAMEGYNYSVISLWEAENVIIKNCRIYGREIGIGVAHSSVAIMNNLIFDNHFIGIVIYGLESRVAVINNTIINNTHYGIDYRDIQEITIRNNMIVGNKDAYWGIGIAYNEWDTPYITPADIAYNNVWGQTTDFYHCSVGAGDYGNTSVDPIFYDDLGHLTELSPSINQGTSDILSYLPPLLIDLDNGARVSGVIDMGAYEYNDTDGDDIPDWWEKQYSLNPNSPSDAGLDPDMDSVTNLQEYQQNSSPLKMDTDGDGMDDGKEVYAGMDPADAEALFMVTEFSIDRDSSSYLLTWSVTDKPDRTYNIYWRENTDDVWQMVAAPTFIDNGDGTNSWRDWTFSGTQRQYKIVVVYDE